MKYSKIHEIEDIELIKYLVREENLDANMYDQYGFTPLHYCNNEDVYNCLLELGADMSNLSYDGYYPYELFSPRLFNYYTRMTDLDRSTESLFNSILNFFPES